MSRLDQTVIITTHAHFLTEASIQHTPGIQARAANRNHLPLQLIDIGNGDQIQEIRLLHQRIAQLGFFGVGECKPAFAVGRPVRFTQPGVILKQELTGFRI